MEEHLKLDVICPLAHKSAGGYLQHSQGKKSPQYLAGLAAALAAMSTGTVLGWTSQISQNLLNGELGFTVTEDELGWISSFMSLGAATLSLLIGIICDFLGRKNTMLFLIIVISIGWVQIICASSVLMLYFGRFITGMVAGAYCVTVPLYTNEIAEKDIRGTLGCFTQLMISVGTLFAVIISKYLSIQHFTICCAAVPIVFGIIFIFMPETPTYLLKKNKRTAAKRAIIRLRGEDYDAESELKEIEANLKEGCGDVRGVFKESFKKTAVQRACIIGVGLMAFKVFCGIDAIIAYLSYIFEATEMELDPQLGTILFGVIQVISGILQSVVVDKLGRRILLIFSECSMTICLFAVALFFLVKERNLVAEEYYIYLNYVPMIALCIFTVAFAMGLGPIPYMMCAEIFPREIRSIMSSLCTFLVWILAFAMIKAFMVVKTSAGTDVSFFIFAILSTIGSIFICYVVPETKGKSLDEVQQLLSGGA